MKKYIFQLLLVISVVFSQTNINIYNDNCKNSFCKDQASAKEPKNGYNALLGTTTGQYSELLGSYIVREADLKMNSVKIISEANAFFSWFNLISNCAFDFGIIRSGVTEERKNLVDFR